MNLMHGILLQVLKERMPVLLSCWEELTRSSLVLRENAKGTKSVLVEATSVFGIIANGTITTGRMNAGAMSASDKANHAELNMSFTDKDGNGDPFYTLMNGKPDSLAVWVKFTG